MTPYEHAQGVVSAASSPSVLADPALAATYIKDLAHGLGSSVVNRAVLAALADTVDNLWRQGWQPFDLVRFTRREQGPAAASAMSDAIAARMRTYPPAVVDPRWAAQLTEAWWTHDHEWLDLWAFTQGLDRASAIGVALQVVGLMRRLGPIPVLIPPPGSVVGAVDPRVRGGRPSLRDGVSRRTLDRIRALLAKAESTTFPEEAETYTAKAQELMARHSIDAALIDAAAQSSTSPAGVRIAVDPPYEMSKSILLDEVARANRCRSVWSKALAVCTVFGFPTDLELVELLYTSLLVQATTAMTAEGSRTDRSSTRSFRQAFLTAYATRIGERLAGATDRAGREAAAELGGSLLPVLAARDEAVQEQFQATFPNLTYRQVTVRNAEGYRSGRAAADRASLNPRRELS